jgi:hypothetical protein
MTLYYVHSLFRAEWHETIIICDEEEWIGKEDVVRYSR